MGVFVGPLVLVFVLVVCWIVVWAVRVWDDV